MRKNHSSRCDRDGQSVFLAIPLGDLENGTGNRADPACAKKPSTYCETAA